MKNYNLYLYFSLLSLQLVSPTPPRINLCCRENHAYKLNTKLPTRKKARCDFTPTVRLDLVTSWPRDSEVVFLVSEILKSSVVDWLLGRFHWASLVCWECAISFDLLLVWSAQSGNKGMILLLTVNRETLYILMVLKPKLSFSLKTTAATVRS